MKIQTWSPSDMITIKHEALQIWCIWYAAYQPITSQSWSARPKDLKRLQWSQVWTTVRMNPDRESLLPKRQMSQMVKLLNFTSNCQFTVQIGIFVRGAVIAYSLCSRFMAKDSRSEKMNHFIFISRALIGWDGSFLILLYPQQARNQFSSSVFTFQNSESTDSRKLNFDFQ